MTEPTRRSGLFVLIVLISLLPQFAAAQGPICEEYWPSGEVVAEISDPVIDESSGLADSWLHDDRLWTHNDSGDEPRLWAMRKDATVTTEVRLVGAENVDWEDMAIAPCGHDDPRPCIYAGDIGDNLSRRDYVTIYRFPEPDLGDEPPESLEITDYEVLTYSYDEGPRDAEALLVHPHTRQIWVIEKTGDPEVAVFSIPEEFGNSEPHVVSSVATLEVPGTFAITRMITAGDISPDGTEFTFRTYLQLFTHCVDDLNDFESAFSTEATRSIVSPATIQGEALTYDRSDGALWLTSEQLPAPLIRIPPRDEVGEVEEGEEEGEGEEEEETDEGLEDQEDSESSQGDADNAGIDAATESPACSTLQSPVRNGGDLLLGFVILLGAMSLSRMKDSNT